MIDITMKIKLVMMQIKSVEERGHTLSVNEPRWTPTVTASSGLRNIIVIRAFDVPDAIQTPPSQDASKITGCR
jgi:hypothetical protein